MVVMEINLPSGFSADTIGLLNDIVKRVDLRNSKLVVYLDQVSRWQLVVIHIDQVIRPE